VHLGIENDVFPVQYSLIGLYNRIGECLLRGMNCDYKLKLRFVFQPWNIIVAFLQPRLRTRKKGKAVPLQALSGPERSRNLRLPDFMITAQDGGKVVSLTHRPPVPSGNTPGTYFC
jgi:hypothetical protein